MREAESFTFLNPPNNLPKEGSKSSKILAFVFVRPKCQNTTVYFCVRTTPGQLSKPVHGSASCRQTNQIKEVSLKPTHFLYLTCAERERRLSFVALASVYRNLDRYTAFNNTLRDCLALRCTGIQSGIAVKEIEYLRWQLISGISYYIPLK